MKILLIIHNQCCSGPFYKILEYCISLKKNDNEVYLMCTSKTDKLFLKRTNIEGINIILSPDFFLGRFRQGIDPWNSLNRICFVLVNRFDVIHAIDCRPVVIFPSIFAKLIKKTYLVISWWDYFGKEGTTIERSGKIYASTFGLVEAFFDERFRKYANKSTVVSHFLENRLISLGVDKKEIHLVRVGCNPNNFVRINKEEYRKKYNISPSRIVLCYVGSIFPNDLELLLKSIQRLHEFFKMNPITIIVGKHKIDDFFKKKFNIIVTGFLESTEEVNQIIQMSDFALLPFKCSVANMARWPSKIGDYLKNGTPIISTKINDLIEINRDYKFGILSQSDTPENFALAIKEAILINESEYYAKQKAGFDFLNTELNISLITKKMLNIYKNSK